MDLVITNDKMPGMDGQEFLTALRKQAHSVPVILLTEHADINAYLKALNLGAYDYVSKPVGMNELNAIVKAAFRGSLQNSTYSGLPRCSAFM
jgi:two-component system response regulator HydG